MIKKSFGILQQVGKALILPVALLPAAGILLAFGNALQNPQFLTAAPVEGKIISITDVPDEIFS